MKFLTFVLTAPRPASTLHKTAASLKAGGFDDLHICDGSPPVGENPSPRWCTAGYMKLFRKALDLCKQADGALVFEDDVVVCKNLRQYLEAIPPPELLEKIAMVSPYCHTAYSNYKNSFPKWHREDQRSVLAGTQAYLYTNHMMELLCQELQPDMYTDGHYTGVDVQAGRIAKAHGLHAWFHVPSLVQHIGIDGNSAVGFTTNLGSIYYASTYVGDEFDAMGLRNYD